MSGSPNSFRSCSTSVRRGVRATPKPQGAVSGLITLTTLTTLSSVWPPITAGNRELWDEFTASAHGFEVACRYPWPNAIYPVDLVRRNAKFVVASQ